VATRALSDEGDDLGLTDRAGPPVSEREATAESGKRSRRRADWAGQGGRRWAAAGLENKGGGRAENKEKGISELKNRFLNLRRLWKFVEGDLGGILT
jgi:hypothetical protein